MAREFKEESGARRVDKTLTIRRPAMELYKAWRHLDQLPSFMKHVVSVEEDGNRSHWVVKAPGGTVEWDAEITADDPGKRIAWHSLGDADVPNAGEVHFRRAPQGRATEVHVTLTYEPPGKALGARVAKVMGESPAAQLDEDLLRFKQLMETGYVPTTRGQPRGAAQRDELDEERSESDDSGEVPQSVSTSEVSP